MAPGRDSTLTRRASEAQAPGMARVRPDSWAGRHAGGSLLPDGGLAD